MIVNGDGLINHIHIHGKDRSWGELSRLYGYPSGEAARSVWKRYRRKKGLLLKRSYPEVNTNISSSVGSQMESILKQTGAGYTLDDVVSTKIWQTQAGDIRYSIVVSEEVEVHLQAFKKDLLESLKKYAVPGPPLLKEPPAADNAPIAILNLFDAHIDKLCLCIETGDESSLEDNLRAFEEGFDSLLTNIASYHPRKIILPIGNDFFHTDNKKGTTVKGTPLEVNATFEDSFIAGLRAIRRCIDKAVQISQVTCPIVRGNHSGTKETLLGACLETLYEKEERVLILNDRRQRKYIKYGQNLFGFAHGDKEYNQVGNLPLLMAEEVKELWSSTTYREWFLGDRHHKMEYKFMRAKDYIGCTIRFLRSVGTTDKWHHENGYGTSPRTAEAFIYDYNKGMVASFLTNII